MGLSVAVLLLDLIIVYIVFGLIMGQLVIPIWSPTGLGFFILLLTLSGYALGCSMVAMFNRVGGVFIPRLQNGADLVGKTEAHIPEMIHVILPIGYVEIMWRM